MYLKVHLYVSTSFVILQIHQTQPCTFTVAVFFITNQSEWAQDWERFVAGETELDETEADDEQVEAVPAVLEVAK